MGAEGVKVSADSILKHLANAKLSKVGRPSAEEKLNRELEEMENEGETEAERYEVPIEEIFLPGDMAEYQERLKDMKPEDLRVKLTKMAFENRGLKRWIKNAVRQIADASRTNKGGKIILPPLPQGVPSELGIEDSSAGVTKVLKELMPQITQYKLVRDILRDSSDENSGDKNMVEIESPDGTKMRLPAGSFIPGLFNPLIGQHGADKKEETITIKLGDKELTGPASSVGLLYQTLVNQGANREATVKIRDEEGEEHEVPASALGAVLDLQKLAMNKKNDEQMITITDDNGKEITMPASFYPQYMMQQQMRQLQEQLKELKEKGSGGSNVATHVQTVPDQTLASVLSAVSEMKDTMRRVNEAMNPQKLSELAVQGLMSKVEEFDRLRAIFGGGKEDAEVQKERIRQQAEIQRAKLLEEMKLKREQEKTKQAELEARKFEVLTQPIAQPATPAPEPNPAPDIHTVYNKAREINRELFEKLNTKPEEETEDNIEEGNEEEEREDVEDLEGGEEENE